MVALNPEKRGAEEQNFMCSGEHFTTKVSCRCTLKKKKVLKLMLAARGHTTQSSLYLRKNQSFGHRHLYGCRLSGCLGFKEGHREEWPPLKGGAGVSFAVPLKLVRPP